MKAYIVFQASAFESDEVIRVIFANELQKAKAHYTTLQNDMPRTSAIIIREIETGLAGDFTGEEFLFYGHK
jgi:hypothetical protein